MEKESRQPDVRKPLNPFGEAVISIKEESNLQLRDISDTANLAGLRAIIRRRADRVSVYTMSQVLQAADDLALGEDQISRLADAVEKTIEITLQSRGALYNRLPPNVPQKIVNETIGYVCFSDSTLARSLLGSNADKKDRIKLASRIFAIRNKLGIEAVFTDEQGKQITTEIGKNDGKRMENRIPKNEFALKIAGILRIDPSGFKKEAWVDMGRRIPNPEEFGRILENSNLTESQRERIVNLWQKEFRDSLYVGGIQMRNEFGITRERLHQLKKQIDPHNRLTSWQQIERIRKLRAKHPNNNVK